ncbi:hypothetical protein [Serratia symbiotica]|uniref:hypothetical protein n=1 Tax=Serratia symbiotica TaxID=138074 RepID=UPI00346462D4
MVSDWKKELHKYENGRSFGKDLKDSFRVACSAAELIASSIPDSASIKKKKQKDGFRDGAEGYGWYVGDSRIDKDY